MQHIVNRQGLNMPKLGLGTWPMLADECTRAVEQGNKVSDIPAIQQIAAKHGALPTQVALKWLLDQSNVAAIPKASTEANQLANLAAFTINLDDQDRALIASLSKRQRQVSPDFAPVWDAFDE